MQSQEFYESLNANKNLWIEKINKIYIKGNFYLLKDVLDTLSETPAKDKTYILTHLKQHTQYIKTESFNKNNIAVYRNKLFITYNGLLLYLQVGNLTHRDLILDIFNIKTIYTKEIFDTFYTKTYNIQKIIHFINVTFDDFEYKKRGNKEYLKLVYKNIKISNDKVKLLKEYLEL